jgi:CPA1 family monovalent cation:H+ antiporter
VFLLNGALFVLIGLEVQYVVHEISAAAIGRLVLITLAVWATLLVVRYVFQLMNTPFQRRPEVRPAPGARARARAVSTIAGMRGAVSLAIALSVPASLSEGGGVGGRDEIVFVTAGVILLSLLVQAPFLPALVRWARFPADHAEAEEYELAERAISGAALAALDDLAAEHGIGQEVRDRVRAEGYQNLEFANARTLAREQALVDAEADALDQMLGQPDPIGIGGGDGNDADGGVSVSTEDSADGTVLQMIATSEDVDLAQRSPLIRHEEHTRLKLALIDRKREVLLGLRGSGTVDDIVVRRISARLDLEQVRLQGIEDYDKGASRSPRSDGRRYDGASAADLGRGARTIEARSPRPPARRPGAGYREQTR